MIDVVPRNDEPESVVVAVSGSALCNPSRSCQCPRRQPPKDTCRHDRVEYFKNAGVFNENAPKDSRFWNRNLLRRATGTANYGQIGTVLEKLNRGEPIVVLAVGSSITASYGGRFEPRQGMVASIVPMPIIMHDTDSDEGWLRMLMHAINTSWPHRGECWMAYFVSLLTTNAIGVLDAS